MGGNASGRTYYAYQILGICVFLAVWELSVRLHWVSTILIPPPSSIISSFIQEAGSGFWVRNIVATLKHYFLGISTGTILGIGLGIAAALWPIVQGCQEGVARLLRPIPPIAWIPFAITWFGVTETAAAFIIAIGAFWVNYFATYTAVRSIDKGLIELAYAYGQGALFRRLFRVIVPSAAPGILSGIRAGLGIGWFGVLAAELFGIPGIGQRMIEASGLLAMNIVMLYMATIALLYSLGDAFMAWIYGRVTRWQA